MNAITESITVDVSAIVAFRQWTKFEHLPQYFSGVERVEVTGPGMTHWSVNVGGVTREFDAETRASESNLVVTWASLDGPRHAGAVRFEPLTDHTVRVVAQLDVDPEGFVENVADKLGLLSTAVKRDLVNFKDFTEQLVDPQATHATDTELRSEI